MFRSLLKFELKLQAKNGIVFAAAAFFVFAGVMLTISAIRFPNMFINAPYSIAYNICILSMGLIFLVTLQCAATLMRERDSKMEQIVYSSSVTSGQFLSARLLAIWLTAFVAFIGFAIGVLAGVGLAHVDASQVGPLSLSHYLMPLLTIALPNTLLCLGVVSVVTMLTRNRVMIYLGGLTIYVLYVASSVYVNAPWLASAVQADAASMAIAALLDPLGTSAFLEQSRYWNAVERNTMTVSLEGIFLYNRLIWLIVSAILLTIAWRLFRFRQPAVRKKQKLQSVDETSRTIAYQPISVEVYKSLPVFFSRLWREITFLAKGIPFVIMLLIWLFVLSMELVPSIQYGIMGSPTYPVTGKIVTYILEIVSFFGAITIIFFSGEVIDRERIHGIYQILDATPVNNLIVLSAKIIAMMIIPLLLILTSIGCGIMIQISATYFDFRIPVYFSLFYYAGIPLFLIGVLAVFMQLLMPNRYLAMLITAVFVLITGSTIGGIMGLEHPLLLYARRLTAPFTDFMGFGSFGTAFGWRMLYWSGIAIVLCVISYGLWRRGDSTFFKRLKRLPGLFDIRTSIIAIIGLATAVGSAAFIQSDINGLYQTRNQERAWSAGYEKTWKAFESKPQPVITDVDLQVDLYPGEQRYTVRGAYQIVNRNKQPLDEALIGLHQDAKMVDLSVSGARLKQVDDHYGYRLFEFEAPLLPGDSASVNFETDVRKSGFLRTNPFNMIVENGTFLRLSRYVPFLGYNADFELSNPDRRRSFGLPEKEDITGLIPREERSPDEAPEPQINLQMIVSTEVDQIVVATGKPVKEWQDKDRRYFQFRSTLPIPNRYAISSARYKTQWTTHNGIDIEVLYHPQHEVNASRVLAAARDALDYCQEQFSPYQYSYMRFAEISLLTSAIGATSYPATLYFVEDKGFLADLRDSSVVDFVYKMVAHETSHQWWGGQLNPRYQEGERLLVETVAAHTESQIYRQAYGDKMLFKDFETEADRYLGYRSFAQERPLFKINGPVNSHVYYHKGALAMAALTRRLGEETVNSVLRRLLEINENESEPPTSLDFLSELRKVAADSSREMIDDWLTRIVIYDIRCDSAFVESMTDGRYQTTLIVSAQKFDEDGNGGQKQMPIDEWLEVGVCFREGGFWENLPDQRALQKYRLHGEKNRIQLVTERLPQLIHLDPFMTKLDRNRVDNQRTVNSTNAENVDLSAR